jgi:hypothetical protein
MWVCWNTKISTSCFSYALFPVDPDEISAPETIEQLIRFTGDLCTLAVQLEHNHLVLSHCLLDFYNMVGTLYSSPSVCIFSHGSISYIYCIQLEVICWLWTEAEVYNQIITTKEVNNRLDQWLPDFCGLRSLFLLKNHRDLPCFSNIHRVWILII